MTKFVRACISLFERGPHDLPIEPRSIIAEFVGKGKRNIVIRRKMRVRIGKCGTCPGPSPESQTGWAGIGDHHALRFTVIKRARIHRRNVQGERAVVFRNKTPDVLHSQPVAR